MHFVWFFSSIFSKSLSPSAASFTQYLPVSNVVLIILIALFIPLCQILLWCPFIYILISWISSLISYHKVYGHFYLLESVENYFFLKWSSVSWSNSSFTIYSSFGFYVSIYLFFIVLIIQVLSCTCHLDKKKGNLVLSAINMICVVWFFCLSVTF